jgi:P27 family predicted phage terminase small subunit
MIAVKNNEQTEPTHDAQPDTPPAPDWLDDAATGEWDRLALALVERHLLTELDLGALGVYCQSYSDYVRLLAALRDEGEVCVGSGGRTARNPKAVLMKQAGDRMVALGARLGLTPADRPGGLR